MVMPLKQLWEKIYPLRMAMLLQWRLVAVVLASGVLLLVGIMVLSTKSENHEAIQENTPSSVITPAFDLEKEWLVLHTRIKSIQEELGAFYQAVEPLFVVPSQLEVLEEKVDQRSEKAALASAQNALLEKLDTILDKQAQLFTLFKEKETASVKKQPPLSEKDIPFELVSIDTWNGTAYLWVVHAQQDSLIAKGESLLGWTLFDIDINKKTVVLENAKKQQITVTVR